MKPISTSVTALAAVGLVLGVGSAAFACDYHATAHATPTPTTKELAAPASTVDPAALTKMQQVAVLPAPPKEESVETEIE